MKVLDLEPPVCPECGHKFGKILAAQGELPKDGTYSVCYGCLSFLAVERIEEKKITFKALDAEGLLALPDDERIKLTRVRGLYAKVKEANPAGYMEHVMKMKSISDGFMPALVKHVESEVEKAFGRDMGIIVIVRELKPQGYQMHMSNMKDAFMQKVLEAAAEKSFEMPNDINEIKAELGKLINELLK